MNYEQIETFLTVVSYGSITSAANYMYLSQSTVSNRIQSLEEELGVQLLYRAKGQRNIELTGSGTAFIAIAEQWASLYKDTQALKFNENVSPLTIAGVDAVNSYTFTGLFNRLLEEHPEIKFTINTHHSNEIYGLVENRSADMGFVFREINYPNIVSRPVFRELMYMVTHKESPYSEGISCTDLPQDQEIFLNWGPDYNLWHIRHWPAERYPLMTVNTGNILQHYLHTPGRWAIAPMSVIQAIQGDDLVFYRLKESPPPRICYQITSRYPNFAHVQAIEQFNKAMEDFIKEDGSICLFEEWMLEEQQKYR